MSVHPSLLDSWCALIKMHCRVGYLFDIDLNPAQASCDLDNKACFFLKRILSILQIFLCVGRKNNYNLFFSNRPSCTKTYSCFWVIEWPPLRRDSSNKQQFQISRSWDTCLISIADFSWRDQIGDHAKSYPSYQGHYT